MKNISRLFLSGALTLALLTAACAEATPTTIATSGPIGGLASPTALATDIGTTPVGTLDTTATVETATVPAGTEAGETPGTDATQTAGVPVTGPELVLLESQFCIQDMAHALLVLPDTMTFEIAAAPGPDTGCNTVDMYQGRQVVICRSQQNTSLSLNLCTDATNCTQLLVELQDCPDIVQPEATATGTLEIGVTDTPVVGTTDTPEAGAATPTP